MPRHRKSAAATKANRLMDDVYREMFQLESRRPGAEMALALALIRAGVCADTLPQRRELWRWLKQVCPICLKMIEDALAQDTSSLPIV
ncbi:MAG: hypothetical protein ACLGSD_15940 [Acidobacteriota bacterium]